MPNEIYSFEIAAEIARATKIVERFADSAQDRLNTLNITNLVSAVEDGFQLIGRFARPVFNALEQGFKLAVENAIEAEEAQTRLANALRVTGDFSRDAVADFEALAESIQKTTRFSDEQVISAAAIAKQYSLTNRETEEAVKVAADLAAVTGDDLNTATQKVARTFSGFVDRELGRTIPGIKALSKESLIAGGALDVIRRSVDGSAEALTNNFAGAVAQTQNAFDELLETVGGFVVNNPTIVAGIKEIQKAFLVLNETLISNGDEIRSLVTDGFLLVVQSIPLFVKGMENVANNLAFVKLLTDKLGASLGALAAALLNPFQAGDIFGQLAEDLDQLDVRFGTFINRSEALFGPIIATAEDLVKRIGSIKDATKDLQKEVSGTSRSGFEFRISEAFSAEEVRSRIEAATKEPIAQLIKVSIEAQSLVDTKFAAAVGTGLVSQALKGAEGARAVVSQTIGAFADTLIPGIGGAVGEIVGELSKGPEHVKKMVEGFAEALPEIIKNIILAVPALIKALSDAVPEIITAIVDSIPEIVQELVRQLPEVVASLAAQMPSVAIALVTGIIENIPEIIEGFAAEFLKIPERFVDALLDAIPGLGGKSGGDSGGLGGLLGNVPLIGGFLDSIVPFADGGRVPDNPALEGDRLLSRLSAGENVIDRSTNQKLERFLDGQGGAGRPLVVQLVLGQQELARAVLDLNRGGFRTS